VWVVVVADVPRNVIVGVPDRHAPAVLVPVALDLVRRRGDTPGEASRERSVSGHHHLRGGQVTEAGSRRLVSATIERPATVRTAPGRCTAAGRAPPAGGAALSRSPVP